MTLPTPQVLLDDGSGAFPYDITSKVLVGPGYSFERGRQDWQGGVTAGSLSLTLNNSDGRFTPGSTTIASPSPIKVDAKIRVKETINGVTFTRFTGYVKQWPVAWPATVSTFATVQLVATDAQARAERQVLKASVTEEALLVSGAFDPYSYWPLQEPSGVLKAADFGGAGNSLATDGSGTALAFGGSVGLAHGGDGGVTFAAGQYLSASGLYGGCQGLMCVVNTTTPGAGTSRLVETEAAAIGLDAAGHATAPLDGGLTSTTVVSDGRPHVVYLRRNGGTATLYVDGVSEASGAMGVSGSGTITVGRNFTGTLAHVGFTYFNVTAADVTRLSNAALTGFDAEAGTARITRLAGYANLPVGTLDTSLTNVAATDIAGRSVWDALQQVTDAEGGVLFFDGSGNLTFHNRQRVSVKTSPDLTLQATALTGDPQVFTDDQQIVNYFEATAEGTGGVTQVVRNKPSETTHGRYSSSEAYLVRTDQEALDRANWIVTNFAEPTTRYGTLTINLYGMTPARAQAVLSAIEIDCWLRIQAMPSQNTGGTTVDLVVEGYAETVTDNTWTLTCNVVNRSLFNTGIYDDPYFGILDSPQCRFGV